MAWPELTRQDDGSMTPYWHLYDIFAKSLLMLTVEFTYQGQQDEPIIPTEFALPQSPGRKSSGDGERGKDREYPRHDDNGPGSGCVECDIVSLDEAHGESSSPQVQHDDRRKVLTLMGESELWCHIKSLCSLRGIYN